MSDLYGDAEMMLRVVGPTRCDGELAATWLGRDARVEELLTITLANMRHAGLNGHEDLPFAIDHALEILSDSYNMAPNIDGRRLQRLADLLGGQFLPEFYRRHIREAAERLASEVRTMTGTAALSV